MKLIQTIRLNIKFKLIIAFTALSVIPAVIIGFISITSNINSYKEISVNNLTEDLYIIKSQLDNFSIGLEEKINFFTSSSSFEEFISKIADAESEQTKKAVEGILPNLLVFTKKTQSFYQIKYIDNFGDEIFILDHKNDGYELLPVNELNYSATNFYMHLANGLEPNTARLLPVELLPVNFEKPIPVISCIYNVVKGKYSGVLVFNIYAEKFFGFLNEEGPLSASGNVMLADANGYYLYQSNIELDWNEFTALRHEMNIDKDFGKDATKLLFNKANDKIFEFKDVIIVREFVFSTSNGLNNEHVLLKSVSKSEMFSPVREFIIFFVSIMGFVLFSSFILAIIAAQEFTIPIKKLWEKAQIIASGNYKSTVSIESKDEIGDLAHQFNLMAGSIDKRDEEIKQHKLLLEEKVKSRTRELENEKNKFQTILDNVPSGLLLINKLGEVLSASAAMEKITGAKRNEIEGVNHRIIFKKYLNVDIKIFEKIFEDGKLLSTEIIVEDKDGECKYFDCLIVPLKKKGVVTAALEIITDITKRRSLQELLVRSEKLATTGEIAAVIAHEIRNSLTSVRMILQLIARDFSETDTDTESVEVALDSINRMEKIVDNLLQLSRPTPLHKSSTNITSIIKRSVEFAQHQIRNKDIKIQLSLTHEPLLINIDKDRFHEAFINLLLNSFQAIHKTGIVTISTSTSVIDKNLYDFGEVIIEDLHENKKEAQLDIKEVVLKKGSRVLKIEFTDNGCGIEKDILNRIFDPFYTTKTDGTGLGLSFVKRVVNQHSGLVLADSQLQAGSKFTILLPY